MVKIESKTCHYEIKILGKAGGYRIFGNKNSNSQIIFSEIEDSH